MPRPPTRIQALSRADALIGAVVGLGAGTPVSLSDLAAHVGLNKVTAFNLLKTLVALGYLEQETGSRRYRLGLRTLELAGAARSARDIGRRFEPVLHVLCRDTGETVNLALPYHGHALIIDSVEGRHGIRTTAYAGERSPYHSTACGKVLLAFMPDEERQAILASIDLAPRTARTITERKRLDRELAAIRLRGWAHDLEENEIGAHCVAAPIFDGDGRPFAAISVSGLKDRLRTEALDTIAQRMRVEIARVSRPTPPTPRSPGASERSPNRGSP